MQSAAKVLVVEDGDEYLEVLRRLLPELTYVQAKGGRIALDVLAHDSVALVFLDMRFDRVPEETLLGDRSEALAASNGDAARALRFLQDNQGLFILAAINEAGFGELPVLISYDFDREPERASFLRQRYPNLHRVAEDAIAEVLKKLLLA